MLELANIDINSVVTTYNSLAGAISSNQGLSALSIFLESYSLLERYSKISPNNSYSKNLKENLSYPKELLEQSINKFCKIGLIYKNSSSKWDQFYKTELGENIFNLIKGEK
ncbi:MAG: hypothetical protein ACTH29_05970 [Fusobacterium sp.]